MEKCRLCYSDTDPELNQNLFNTKLDPPPWKTIKQLSNLMIEKNDPYSKMVCVECFVQLKKINTFRQTMLDTDRKIRSNHEELMQKLNNNSNDSVIPSAPIKVETIDYNLNEEPVEIDEDPLKIENDTFVNSNISNNIESNDKNKDTIITDYRNNDIITDKSETIDRNSIKIEKKSLITKKLKQNQCNVCYKTFQRRALLLRHSTVHTGEKPYQCDVCEKKFRQLGHLIEHKRIHTGEKPYQCTICERRFRHLCSFKKHSNVHNRIKPFNCTLCNKKFTHRKNLYTHLIKLHMIDKGAYQ